ncbi:hypothetical protein [Vibrio phage vB_pir03]|nr:hypothetical protein [Vibrio phage vB_pir03]
MKNNLSVLTACHLLGFRQVQILRQLGIDDFPMEVINAFLDVEFKQIIADDQTVWQRHLKISKLPYMETLRFGNDGFLLSKEINTVHTSETVFFDIQVVDEEAKILKWTSSTSFGVIECLVDEETMNIIEVNNGVEIGRPYYSDSYIPATVYYPHRVHGADATDEEIAYWSTQYPCANHLCLNRRGLPVYEQNGDWIYRYEFIGKHIINIYSNAHGPFRLFLSLEKYNDRFPGKLKEVSFQAA